ncbi:hypothetical protein Tco_0842077 [Tanacetum coccineum]|uniref:Uncharacterized protein n=1 Tax=Tanacetum coccineum TaxID=301880 RepID=A0ABQ5AYT5_9ASTR
MDDNQVNETNLKGKDVVVEENQIVDAENQVMDKMVADLDLKENLLLVRDPNSAQEDNVDAVEDKITRDSVSL